LTDEHPRDFELERQVNAGLDELVKALARTAARVDHQREIEGLPPLYTGSSAGLVV